MNGVVEQQLLKAVYLSKFVVAQALVLISTLVLALLTVVVGLVATSLKPELANVGPAPYVWILKHALLVWLAAWLIIAIPTWISVRWAGFPIALGAGIGGTFFALFAAGAAVGKLLPVVISDEHPYQR